MNKKQDIVPVKLEDQRRKPSPKNHKRMPQKLIARLKHENSELFIYEDIQESVLKAFLSELYHHGNR